MQSWKTPPIFLSPHNDLQFNGPINKITNKVMGCISISFGITRYVEAQQTVFFEGFSVSRCNMSVPKYRSLFLSF